MIKTRQIKIGTKEELIAHFKNDLGAGSHPTDKIEQQIDFVDKQDNKFGAITYLKEKPCEGADTTWELMFELILIYDKDMIPSLLVSK